MGRLRGRTVAEANPIEVFVPINHQQAEMRQPLEPVSNPPAPRPEQVLFPLERVMYQQPTGPRNEDEIINNFPELFDCFSSEGFDLEQFKLFSRNFFKESTREDTHKRVGPISKGKGEDCVRACTKPLHVVHAVKGANEKHHILLEGDDCLYLARVQSNSKQNPCEL